MIFNREVPGHAIPAGYAHVVCVISEFAELDQIDLLPVVAGLRSGV